MTPGQQMGSNDEQETDSKPLRLLTVKELLARGPLADRGDCAEEGHGQAHLGGRLGMEGAACTSLTASSKLWLLSP
jgi:hypothetical protein